MPRRSSPFSGFPPCGRSDAATRTPGPRPWACSIQPTPKYDAHYFPAYAPELNLAEYVRAQADHELASRAPDDLRELRQRLTDATRRLRRSQDLLWSCIYASDLPWAR